MSNTSADLIRHAMNDAAMGMCRPALCCAPRHPEAVPLQAAGRAIVTAKDAQMARHAGLDARPPMREGGGAVQGPAVGRLLSGKPPAMAPAVGA